MKETIFLLSSGLKALLLSIETASILNVEDNYLCAS